MYLTKRVTNLFSFNNTFAAVEIPSFVFLAIGINVDMFGDKPTWTYRTFTIRTVASTSSSLNKVDDESDNQNGKNRFDHD